MSSQHEQLSMSSMGFPYRDQLPDNFCKKKTLETLFGEVWQVFVNIHQNHHLLEIIDHEGGWPHEIKASFMR
jgi:hypothetical protein